MLLLFLILLLWAAERVVTLRTHGFVVAWAWRMQAAGRGMLVASLEMEDLLVQPLWKTVWQFLRKLKIELLYN